MRFAPHTALPRVKGVHQPRDSAVFFSKQTATAIAGGRCASVEQVGTGGEGRRRGRAVIHILPPLLFARLCDTAGRQSLARHNLPPPPPLPPKPHKNSQRTQTVKVRRGEGSSTQLNTFALCSPHFRPPVYYRHQVRGSQRPGFVYRHVVAVVVRFAPENISVYV